MPQGSNYLYEVAKTIPTFWEAHTTLLLSILLCEIIQLNTLENFVYLSSIPAHCCIYMVWHAFREWMTQMKVPFGCVVCGCALSNVV
jgi:hypothetical protein